MRIWTRELVRLLDERVAHGSHVGAINGLIGEDLLLGLFRHWLESRGPIGNVDVEPKCLPGTRSGGRLDAKVYARFADGTEELYQVEAKNWCASSYKEVTLAWQADVAAHTRVNALHWDYMRKTLESTVTRTLNKVLGKMVFPKCYAHLTPTPLALMWWAVAPDDGPTTRFLSEMKLNSGRTVSIFSCRNYLSSLQPSVSVLNIPMPRVEQRLQLLMSILDFTSCNFSSSTCGTAHRSPSSVTALCSGGAPTPTGCGNALMSSPAGPIEPVSSGAKSAVYPKGVPTDHEARCV